MTDNNFSYALTNPLSLLLNKPAYEFQRSDLLKIIEKKQIERITFHYTAIDGRLKELKLPVSNKESAERILANGERVDGSSLFKGLVDASVSDLYIIPQYKTAFLNPFDKGSLDFMCRFFTKEGELAPFASDSILNKAYSLFKNSTDLDIHCLGELEFFLISETEKELYRQKSRNNYHESSPFVKSGAVLTEILRYITQLTDAVKYAHSEAGYIDRIESEREEINGKQAEQMEVEFSPRPVDEMADDLVLGRWLIRNIAYRHGCIATFAPKIAHGIAGNGFHIHIQLMKKGKNIMKGADGRLSEKAERLVGGLCDYADSLTAFGNTTASSYLRLVPGQEAPTKIFWSGLNRQALIRVPLAWSKYKDLAKKINPQESSMLNGNFESKTVELRTPDGSAFVHLLIAGIVMAAEWGLKQKDSLDKAKKLYVRGQLSKDQSIMKSYKSLPGDCKESSKILKEKRSLYEREGIFPSYVIDYIADLLEKEDMDLSQYTTEEGLRKIMHRDLHKH
ncbi:MAG: glutamine synthetase [Candidatus Aminicenantes bacterium]|nr:glutamine synthetase [Candidatus Aminicenantes bacterium]